MKEFGQVMLKAVNKYPIATFCVTALVVSNIAYNVCVLIDRKNQYKYLAKNHSSHDYC